MAMVIDDRLQVWDEKDQPRVHVVPAYTPYYAPQAEVFICILLLTLFLVNNISFWTLFAYFRWQMLCLCFVLQEMLLAMFVVVSSGW